jgi:branched-chain amino acid transport system permease protein
MSVSVAFLALMLGMLYAGVALGLTLTFGLLGTINFAHGQLMVLGGYVTYWAMTAFGVNFWLALILAIIGVGLVGFLIERTTFQFLNRNVPSDPNARHRSSVNGFIMSLGLVLIIQNLILYYWQTTPRVIPQPITGTIHIGSVVLIGQSLATIGVLVILIGAFVLFLRYVKIGKGIRATGINRLAAETVGINTKACASLSFVIGSAMAGAMGALWGALYVVTPFMGDDPLIKGFVVVVLGGLGSVPGAVAGGIAIAFVETLGVTLTSSTYEPAFAFGAMILILLFRPQGLLGVNESRGA